jgi:hypothetical protein
MVSVDPFFPHVLPATAAGHGPFPTAMADS